MFSRLNVYFFLLRLTKGKRSIASFPCAPFSPRFELYAEWSSRDCFLRSDYSYMGESRFSPLWTFEFFREIFLELTCGIKPHNLKSLKLDSSRKKRTTSFATPPLWIQTENTTPNFDTKQTFGWGRSPPTPAPRDPRVKFLISIHFAKTVNLYTLYIIFLNIKNISQMERLIITQVQFILR